MRILPLVLLLAACGGKSNDPVVLLQQERDPAVRRASVLALLAKGPGAEDLWRRLLGDGDPEIARLAASAIRQGADRPEWREIPESLTSTLLEAAARKEPDVRVEAILALARLRADDPLFPPKVAGALADPDPRVRRAALQAFRSFGPSTAGMDLAPLAAILAKEPALSLDAALALSACGSGSPAVLDRLAAAVEDGKDPASALQAARALSALGSPAGAASPRLAPRLAGAPELLAREIADALGQAGVADPAVVAALEKALARREPSVSVAAALSLARLGRAGPDAEKVLAGPARDPLDGVRRAEGAVLLGKGGWPPITAALSGEAAAEAALAIARLAAAGKPLPADARKALEAAADSPSLEVRRAVRRAEAAAKSR